MSSANDRRVPRTNRRGWHGGSRSRALHGIGHLRNCANWEDVVYVKRDAESYFAGPVLVDFAVLQYGRMKPRQALVLFWRRGAPAASHPAPIRMQP